MRSRIKNQESRIRKLTHNSFRYLITLLIVLYSLFFILPISHTLAATDFKLTLPDSITYSGDADFVRVWNSVYNLVFAFLAVMAFVGIVYSGIMMITAGGDSTKFATGKKNLIWAIIGIVVLTISYFVTIFVFSFIQGITK